jgi:hypothetical protein
MKVVSGVACAILLAGCNGGGSDGGNAPAAGNATDVIDTLIQSYSGGSRYISLNATDGPLQSSPAHGCSREDFSTRAVLESDVSKQGGTIFASSRMSGVEQSAMNQSISRKLAMAFMVDSRDAQETDISLYLPQLLAEHMTVIEFSAAKNGLNAMAKVLASTKDATIPSDGKCSVGTLPTIAKEAINGQWNGYRMDYSPTTKSGSTTNVNMTCTAQSCDISGLTTSPVILSEFSNGTWRTASGSRQLAGASITADQKLLSAFCVIRHWDESKTLENCSFFTFKR